MKSHAWFLKELFMDPNTPMVSLGTMTWSYSMEFHYKGPWITLKAIPLCQNFLLCPYPNFMPNIHFKECTLWFMVFIIAHYYDNIILWYNSLNFLHNHGARVIPTTKNYILPHISHFKDNELVYSA